MVQNLARRYEQAPAQDTELRMHLVADLPSAEEIRPYLERMDAGRWYTNFGPLVREFEHNTKDLLNRVDLFSQFGPVELTTLVTCYHALEIGLRMQGVGPGDRVLMPAVTFPACPLAVQHIDAEPVLADINPELWALTPEIARRAAEKTRLAAVMPVAIYGIPLPVEGWNDFTRDTGIPVLIDAAAAFETQQIPEKGLVVHSLHATKPFGVGEGGLLVTRDGDLIARARVYSNFGTVERIAHTDGMNAKMSEYHAAVGLAQLTRWERIKKKRRALLTSYRVQLAHLADVVALHPGIATAVTSLLMLRSRRPLPADIMTKARKEGLALHRTYLPPLYRHPHFADLVLADESGKVLAGDAETEIKAAHMRHSESLAQHLIGAPFHPFLDEDDIERSVAILQTLID